MVQLVAISVTSPFSFDFNTSYVMVQPRTLTTKRLSLGISIHLMLWFNKSQKRCISSFGISIHLMLWFNRKPCIRKKRKRKFQYILCYGSTLRLPPLTSRTKISIHLMLWFNLFLSHLKFSLLAFQYILCYGSTSIRSP